MSLSIRDRKILWARAGNRCSYNYEGEACDQELVTSEGGKRILVGEECHIVGEKPRAPRYIANYQGINTYANLILMCRKHHKIIDDNEQKYTVAVLQKMKQLHETSVTERIKREEIKPIVIKDSVFITKAKHADEATAMEVDRPTILSNVEVNLEAEDVRKATGFKTNQSLSSIIMTCSSCGKPFPFVCTGPRPPSATCPHCGKENLLP